MKSSSFIYYVIIFLSVVLLSQSFELPFSIVGYSVFLSLLIIITSVILILKQDESDKETMKLKLNKKMFLPLLGIIIFIIVVEYIGWFFSLFLLIMSFQFILSRKKYISIVLNSSFWILLSFLVFEKVLHLNFPMGKIWELL
ncbi:tripartite tricarboxylate transporter TctB family protein [Bacteriovoracaceae bacterium]|nr:tripartite tricarboxylate transporter TctB family protein [Bacteriovoracaceae bacterium]